MEKPLDEKASTGNQTNIHLWAASRKHKAKPSKESLISELAKQGLKRLELTSLSVDSLSKLLEAVSSGKSLYGDVPTGNRKAPFLEYLTPLEVPGLDKCPIASLQGLCEYLHDRF